MKWSYSAHTAMRCCQRQLIFGHFMASHNARDPQRREAYILKQLQHLSAWQGSLVHSVLATDFVAALRARRAISAEALTASAQDLARRQLAFSAARRYREPCQTKSAAGDAYCALFEHEYGWDISQEHLEAVHSKVARCFQNLSTQTGFLASLYSATSHYAEVPVSFRLNDITVAATLDLVSLRAGARPTVVDWKVAESGTSDYSQQLLVYALAAARCGRWSGASPEAIELYEVNLLKNQIRRHPVSVERLEETEDFIYRSLVELQALVGDGGFQSLDLSEFEVAERPMTCFHCNFKSLCTRLLDSQDCSGPSEAIQGRL